MHSCIATVAVATACVEEGRVRNTDCKFLQRRRRRRRRREEKSERGQILATMEEREKRNGRKESTRGRKPNTARPWEGPLRPPPAWERRRAPRGRSRNEPPLENENQFRALPLAPLPYREWKNAVFGASVQTNVLFYERDFRIIMGVQSHG